MKSIEVILEECFHLRVAAKFVQCVRRFRSNVRVCKGKFVADGKNILALLALAAGNNATLCFEVEGHDADLAIESIRNFFQPSNLAA